MPNITVNPTRMELTRLKGKLRTAQRGHKLLKDKRDELMKQFLDTVREVRALRQEVEEELMTVHGAFTVASALMSSQALEQALLDPKQSVKLTQTTKNIMSVNVPVYDFQTQTRSDADIYPYGFAATSGELDTAVDALGKVFRKMLKLAEVEKSAQLMAEEIEKTRRRVNALEYVVIPNTQDAIRYITMKLDENDRATTTRLMKVKDMLLQQSIEEQRQRDAEVLERFREVKERWAIPTQTCVLAHVTTQMECIRKGAPTDLIFQSIAGSQKGNEAFGFSADTLAEARALALREGTATGPNVLYFETGQGSELSSEAHNGWDQVTMEARCYGFARHFEPFLVNTVVGFIGPEYLYNAKQVLRAGLEDHFMGKLTGIPMGCDACYTNHMKADQNDIENLATLLVAAGCNYVMGVPEGDDCMLMYQCTGYHEAASMREVFGLRPIHEFDMWLEKMGFSENGKLTPLAGDASVFMTK